MTILLSILLVSVFTGYGLVVLWAVTSKKHPIVRTGVSVGVLLPLLIARAFEPFLVLIIEATTIALGVALFQVWRSIRGPAGDPGTIVSRLADSIRFSITSILLVMAVAATVLAVIANLDELNSQAWITIVLLGIGAGSSVLLSCAAVSSLEAHRGRFRWLVLIVAMVSGGLLISVPLACFDWLLPSFTSWDGWPPDTMSDFSILGFADPDRPIAAWFVICPMVALLVGCWVIAARACRAASLDPVEPPVRLQRPVAVSLFVSISVVVCFVCACGLWVLMRPAGTIEPHGAAVDAYDEIVRIAGEIDRKLLDVAVVGWYEISDKELSAAVESVRKELEMLATKLESPTRARIDYADSDSYRGIHVRNASRAFAAKGRLAMSVAKQEEATESMMSAVRLGFATRRGGLLIDGVIGIACTSDGTREIHQFRTAFSSLMRARVASELLKLADHAEPYEAFRSRDRIWVRRTMGWHGRLQQFLFDITGESLLFSLDDLGDRFKEELVLLRLLAVQLAIDSYMADQAGLPESLSMLVPDYLDQLPADPFDVEGRTFRYSVIDEQIQLYSLGADRTDDGGKAVANDDMYFPDGSNAARDLTLDSFFGAE